MLHAVIMAGGGGTRFWPRSRQKRPKQFLTLTGERSLLQQAAERIEAQVPPERCWVLTAESYREETARQYDTATMLVMPADHVIEPTQEFRRAIHVADQMAEEHPDSLITFGISPN